MSIEDALAKVREATNWVRDADSNRAAAISSAHDAGATVTAIADAAKLSRPAIYRVLNSNPRALPPTSLWRATMGDALVLLMAYGSQHAGDTIGKHHSMPVDALARRVLNSVRQIGPAPTYDSGDWERIAVAMDVAQEILRRQKDSISLAGL